MARWILQPDWSDETARLLHDTLRDSFWKITEIQEIWQDIGLSLGDIDWSGAASVVWPALTRDAAGRQKLEKLIQVACLRRPAAAGNLAGVLDTELPDPAWYACGNRYQARLFGPGLRRTQVDRASLSSALQTMISGNYPLLTIQGNPGSGKSHSRHLIQHVAADPRIQATLLVLDIAEEWPGEAEEVDVVDFVTRLAQRLGMSATFDPDRYTECHRTARELNSEFVGRFGALPKGERWIFIDGLDRANVTTGVRAFIGNLAREVEMAQIGATRLIVTGHPGDFSTSVLEVMIFDRIEEIGVEHLHLFFSDIAAHLGVGLDQEVRDQLVKDVLHDAPLIDLRGLGLRAGRAAHHHFTRGG